MWGEGKGEEREETRSSSQEVKGTKGVSKQNVWIILGKGSGEGQPSCLAGSLMIEGRVC